MWSDQKGRRKGEEAATGLSAVAALDVGVRQLFVVIVVVEHYRIRRLLPWGKEHQVTGGDPKPFMPNLGFLFGRCCPLALLFLFLLVHRWLV